MADAGKKISVLKLEGESIFVNGNDVLAFEPSIKSDILPVQPRGRAPAGLAGEPPTPPSVCRW